MSRRLVKDFLRVGVDFISRKLARQGRGDAIRLLNYHEVLSNADAISNPYNQVTVSQLESHVDALLSEGYRFVTVSEMVRILDEPNTEMKKVVGLTFDDGLVEHVDSVLPILEERQIVATFYVVTGVFGQTSKLGRGGLHLDVDGLLRLANSKMEVGSHSHSHAVLSRLAPDELRTEVSGSRDMIRDILGLVPASFCYPYGTRRTYNEKVIEAVKLAGYGNAVCTSIGCNSPSSPRLQLNRVPVYGYDKPETVVARAAGAFDWLGDVQETWLNWFPHHSTKQRSIINKS